MSERKETRRPAAPARRAPSPPTGADALARARAGGRGFTLTTAWAAAVLGLLVVLFFHEVVVGGKTFVSPDTTAPAGFVRVGEQVLYGEKTYPLWNPYVFLGMPSFASGAYNPLIYPPDWPVAILQKYLPLPELTWMLIYYFLGGLFAFLLAREWGARPEGALLGAIVFTFAPNLVAVGSHGHGSQLVNSAYLPLMVWLASRWMRRGRLRDLSLLAIAGGFQLLRGHVQICFYSWMAVGLYVIADLVFGALRRPANGEPDDAIAPLPARLVRAASIAGAAALAFGIAGFYNLPLRDYAQHSIRGGGADGGVGMGYATSWSLAPYELPTVVVPGWTGFGNATYWGGMPFTDYPNAFIGMTTVVLAIPAVFARGWLRIFALGLATFAILISFGRYFPLYGFLYDHLPLFNKFRIPVMIVLLFHLAAALGLAWGWGVVLDGAALKPEAKRRISRLLVGVAVALSAALVIGVFAQDAWRNGYVANAIAKRGPENYTAELGGMAYREYVGDLGRACLYGLLAIGLGLLVLRGRLGAGLATVAIAALLAIELWPIGGKLMLPVIGPPAQRDLEIGRDDVVEFLEKAGPPGTFRVLPLDEFQSNRYSGFAIATVGGYHAAKPKLVDELIQSQTMTAPMWLRVLNVRFLVTRQTLEPAPPFLRLVHQGSANVYENLAALPRATLVGAYRVAANPRAIIDSIAAGTSDPAEVTWLVEDPKLDLGATAGGTATIARYGLNHVDVDVETPGPALVRLADAWYPDWVARVDGQPAPVLRADFLLRAVPVPAGTHRVAFEFASPPVRNGFRLSIASLVVALLLLGFGEWRERRRRRPAPAPATPAAA